MCTHLLYIVLQLLCFSFVYVKVWLTTIIVLNLHIQDLKRSLCFFETRTPDLNRGAYKIKVTSRYTYPCIHLNSVSHSHELCTRFNLNSFARYMFAKRANSRTCFKSDCINLILRFHFSRQPAAAVCAYIIINIYVGTMTSRASWRSTLNMVSMAVEKKRRICHGAHFSRWTLIVGHIHQSKNSRFTIWIPQKPKNTINSPKLKNLFVIYYFYLSIVWHICNISSNKCQWEEHV